MAKMLTKDGEDFKSPISYFWPWNKQEKSFIKANLKKQKKTVKKKSYLRKLKLLFFFCFFFFIWVVCSLFYFAVYLYSPVWRWLLF